VLVDFHEGVLITLGLFDECEPLKPFKYLRRNL